MSKLVITICAVMTAGMLLASENLITRSQQIVKGQTLADGSMELPLSRERKEYNPPIFDGGLLANPLLRKGHYKLSFSFKGEKVETTTVWFELKMADKKAYPAKNFIGLKGTDWEKVAFEFDVPEDCVSTTFALMFKTSTKNTGVKVLLKDLELIAVPAEK